MGILSTTNKQLIYIYSEASQIGREGYGALQNVPQNVRVINIDKEKLSDPIWLEIAGMIGTELKNLFDYEMFQSFRLVNSGIYTVGDWLNIIGHRPYILQRPIAINGTQAASINNTFELYNFYGVSTQGLQLPTSIHLKAL